MSDADHSRTPASGAPLRVGSVCSGICAPEVAWQGLGFEFIFRSEIEPFPNAVAAHHFQALPNLGDMTRHHEWPAYAIDLLVGGTPCQSFSVAGLRAGLADPRGNLALVFLAILDRYRPTWMVWENVPGVHSSWSDAAVRVATGACGDVESRARQLAFEAGLDAQTIGSCGGFEEADQTSDFDCFLAGLEELGYGAATCVLDAQYFGVAQRRERVCVVGHIGGQWQRAAAVLFESACLSGNPAPRREPGKGTPETTARSVAIRGRDGEPQAELGDDKSNAILTPNGGRGGIGVGAVLAPAIGKALGANTGGIDREDRHTLICATLKKNYATHHGRSAGNNSGVAENQLIPEVAAPLKAESPSRRNGGSDPIAGEFITVAHALRAEGFDASEDGTGRGVPLVADCLQERDSKGSDSSTKNGHLLPMSSGMAVRRLTPRECERLQGFPDDYTQIPWHGKPAAQCPDGPRYKALGNSMAVPVMRWLGQRIQMLSDLRPPTSGL